MKRLLNLLLILSIFLSCFGCTDDISTINNNLENSATVTDGTTISINYNESYLQTETTVCIGQVSETNPTVNTFHISLDSIPAYSGSAYVTINNNMPTFTSSELTVSSYEYYSNLDSLGRCATAMACIGTDIMPTAERGTIGDVKPSGWHLVKYDCVDGKYLYNRCHLIGYQLTGENANTKNLITGTRYLNVEGMLPFEDMVADYITESDNHVLYRVTPLFDGNNLLASGVQMEAFSVEDNGEGICFNVFCYNVQPLVTINYTDGSSYLEETTQAVERTVVDWTQYRFILNTNTKKIHIPSCAFVDKMNESNKAGSNDPPDELLAMGYEPCEKCQPCVKSTTEIQKTESAKKNATTVYVSNNGKIHKKSDCSGMKYYTEMTYDEAIASGFVLCKKCY